MNIHLRTALSNIRRSPLQSIAAFLTLTVTFFLTTTILLLVVGAGNVITFFETKPQVIVFIKKDATTSNIETLYRKLSSDPRIKEVDYVTREEAMSLYKELTKDNPTLSELVSPSIFPASFEFSLINLDVADEIITELKNETVTDQVGFTASFGGEESLQDSLTRLKRATFYLKLGGGVLVSIFLTTSLFVLVSVVSMRLMQRRDEVELLNLVGATKGFIRAPVVIEAFFYNVVSLIIGFLISLTMFLYVSPSVISYFGGYEIFPRDVGGLAILFSAIFFSELLAGTVISLLSGFLAVSRSYRKK